ncbi:MAG: hypothetical protein KJO51_02380, partial [Gramella sp.]|nr:hypothetical protein [Christiangramia sp.]
AYTCDHFSFQNAGHVRIENEVYFINLQITSEYIHSFTCSGRINWKIYPLSTLPKKELLRQMISDLGYTNEYLEMRKDQNGIPSLHKKNSLKKIPFSLSHHGDFTALSIPLINC